VTQEGGEKFFFPSLKLLGKRVLMGSKNYKSGGFFSLSDWRWLRVKDGEGGRRCPRATWDEGAEGVHERFAAINLTCVAFVY